MKHFFLLFTSLLFIFLTGCNSNYGDDFYGTYLHNEFEVDSKLIFYKQNTYSFNSFGTMRNCDSGSVLLHDDTLYFTSFYKKRDELDIENNNHHRRTLTGTKFIHRNDKIYYIRCTEYPDKHKICDTTIWIKTN
jgi:hypothetical protein